MEMNHQQLSIVLIGAGNLATHLAKALYRSGNIIQQVYSRTEASAVSLAKEVEATPVTTFRNVTNDADLYIVALKDAVLEELIPVMVKGKEEALWVHTAGSIPMSVWEGHGLSRYGVFYPMQTFSKQREVCFSSIPVFVESNRSGDLELLKTVASSVSKSVYEADSEQRRSLHLAAVFCCNFTNHMYALAAELLEKYGLPFDTMKALIDETATKVHELPPYLAQTGPAVRNDVNVMNKHLQMLEGDAKMQAIYRLISDSIHERRSERKSIKHTKPLNSQ